MLLIVFLLFVSEKPSRVWKRSSIAVDRVVTALSFVDFGIVQDFLHLHSKSVSSDVVSFCCLVFVFYRKGKRV